MKNNIVVIIDKLKSVAVRAFCSIELRVKCNLANSSLISIRVASSLIFGFIASTIIVGVIFSLLNFYLVIAFGLAIGTGVFIKASKEDTNE